MLGFIKSWIWLDNFIPLNIRQLLEEIASMADGISASELPGVLTQVAGKKSWHRH
jgi:hypothetical protein